MITSGVSFDSVHSYKNWGLILAKQEIGLPSVKTAIVEIPCADGVLDLTESLTGGVCYGNRELKLTFVTTDKLSGSNWASLLSKIAAALHGQQKTIVFDDDSTWAYTGRCQIDTFTTSGAKREIVIRCSCEPYKHGVANSTTKSL